MSTSSSDSFFSRHEFLILRLHSLTGLFPVGAYMVVHLLTNASVLAGAPAFQRNVDAIHALGPVLPLVEWTFIFLPIIFHAVVGVMIVRSGRSNASRYNYAGNIRYTLQRATAWIALVFIAWHVFHMHGLIHNDYWMNNLAKPLYGGQFDAERATSSVALALAPLAARIAYAIGVGACVYHFANGLWTMGITWGLWQSAAAQRRANWLCGAIGLLVLAVAIGAWVGAIRVGEPENLKDAEAYELARSQQQKDFEEREARIKEELKPEQTNRAAARPTARARTVASEAAAP
ncbi:MAG: succinate dehydrogenase cytochrome b558 subunit [Planctomycetia bacterium]|nr:succinate dehydrogenase cytochrome b558 subunit [Planctomycetia bacterium]